MIYSMILLMANFPATGAKTYFVSKDSSDDSGTPGIISTTCRTLNYDVDKLNKICTINMM